MIAALSSREVLIRPSLAADRIDVFHGWCETDGARHVFTRRCLDGDWLNSKITFDGKELDFGEDPRPFVFHDRPAVVACVLMPRYGYRNHLYEICGDVVRRSILLIPGYLPVGKNWTPFVYDDGALGIIHSLDPLVILKERRREQGAIVLDAIHGFSARSEMGPGGFSTYRGGTNGVRVGRYVLGIGHTSRAFPHADKPSARKVGQLLRRPFGWALDPRSGQLQFFDVVSDFANDLRSINPTSLIRRSETDFDLFLTEVSGDFADRTARCEVVSYRLTIGRQFADLMTSSVDGKVTFGAAAFHSEIGRRTDDRWLCDLAGVSRIAIYGPYRLLPAGRYIVDFDLSARELHSATDARLRVEVVANVSTYLAHEDIPLGSGERGGASPLRFDHDRESDLLEFRIYAHGFLAGTIAFGGVSVRPAG